MDLTRLHSFGEWMSADGNGHHEAVFSFGTASRRQEGQVGLALHLPPAMETFRVDISPHVKGWVIDDNDQSGSAPGLRPVVLIPTVWPLNATRCWHPFLEVTPFGLGELGTRHFGHLGTSWLAASMTVLRPTHGCFLHLWIRPLGSTQAMDTTPKPWWVARCRLEVGTLADVGESSRTTHPPVSCGFPCLPTRQSVGRTCHASWYANPEVTSFCVPWP